jgi:hypothetical protein
MVLSEVERMIGPDPSEVKGIGPGHSICRVSVWQHFLVVRRDTSRREVTEATTARCQMIRKISSNEYRLYSRKKNPKTGRRRNLGTFKTRAAAEKHERAVQYFKHG